MRCLWHSRKHWSFCPAARRSPIESLESRMRSELFIFWHFWKNFHAIKKLYGRLSGSALRKWMLTKKHTMFYSKTIVNAKYIQYILIWLENSEPCNVYFQKKTSIQRFECFIKAVNFVNGDDNLTQWTRKRLIDFKLLCTRATLIWNSRTSVLTVSVRKLLVQAHFIPSFGHRK